MATVPEPEPAIDDWPGKRLGLPATGPRSIAQLGRRVLGVTIDWAVASGVAYLFFGGEALAISLVFVALQIVLVATLSGSLGHLVLGMRVVPLRPTWIGVVKPTIRAILLALVIPAVIFDRDERGLHDRLAGTVLVRR